MKPLFYSKTLIALAVAIAATAGQVSQAQEQPIPPPASDSGLPPNIQPGSPVAEVVKLVQAGTEAGVIKNFIANCKDSFDLDAEKIVVLTDLGVPAEIVNAMMAHDKLSSAPVPEATVTTVAAPATMTAPPTAEVTVNYFDNTLTPYGSWVEVEGYGRCWRPTVVVYDPSWQPYRERGHWVYSDHGWYWDSEYSWGVTFHYGRWFQHARWGWCWWPDTVWAPSWVTWRSSDDYCGWAPLPPFAVYRPGGFYYRGTSVSVGFDFGLSPLCFTFISPSHFCAPHPRYYCVEPRRNVEIFHRTTIINNFSEHREGNRRGEFVNGGIPIERINRDARHPIQPVHIGEIRNAERQGWRGNDFNRDDHRPGNGLPAAFGGHNMGGVGPQRHADGDVKEHPQGNRDFRPANNGVNHPAGPQNDQHNGRADHNDHYQNSQPGNQGGNQKSPARPSSPAQNEDRNNRSESHGNNHNVQADSNIPLGNNSGAPAATFNRAERDGQTSGGLRQNRPSASVGPVILTGPTKASSPQTPLNPSGNQTAFGRPFAAGQNENRNSRPENHGNTHSFQAGNSVPVGNNFGATAATFNRAERGGQTVGGQNHNQSVPSMGTPAGNNSGTTAATFNRAERDNRMNNNNNRPTSPGGPPVVGTRANTSPPSALFHAPEHSVQPNNPQPNHDNDKAAVVAPVPRSQPQMEQRQARVEPRSEPRQNVAPPPPVRIQPTPPSQPRSSDQSSDRSSGRDKDQNKH